MSEQQQQQQQQQVNDASFFQYQQRLFYEFLGDCLVNWIKEIKTKPATTSTDQSTDTPKKETRSFIDTWTYNLYQRGIKRRRLVYGDNIPDYSGLTSVDELPNSTELKSQGAIGKSPEADAEYLAAFKAGNACQRAFYGNSSSVLLQFYYDKNANGFNKSDPMTMFCRHLVFDVNSMSVVSVGIPGALSYESFMTSLGSDGVVLEEFLEGTMVIYNQSLGQYKQNAICVADQGSDETVQGSESDDVTVQKKMADMATTSRKESLDMATTGRKEPLDMATTSRKEPADMATTSRKEPLDWSLSTRRKLGTSFFNNPGKTFDQMFKENNQLAGTVLDDKPLLDRILVFNLEHTENRVVNPSITNRNTLVAAYELPSNMDVIRQSMNSVLNVVYNSGQFIAAGDQDDTTSILAPVKDAVLGHGALTQLRQIPIIDMSGELMTKHSVTGIRLPTRLFTYHGTDPMTVINSMLNNMDKYMPGIMLKTAGETRRTKVRNPAHYELLKIKGSGPITISDRNKQNLFKVYWNLHQQNNAAIQKFLEVFDTAAGTYRNIFAWYDVLIAGMIHNLFTEYHNVFVLKRMPAKNISFAFKPLCGDLHNLYKSNRSPVTRDTVTKLINGLEHNQVYWRLFGIDN